MIYVQFMKMMGMGEPPPSKKEQNKHPFGFPPIPPIYKMEANYFPVLERTENKPNLPH